MSLSCVNRVLICNETGITGVTQCPPAPIPSNMADYYYKVTHTENSAGSLALVIYISESSADIANAYPVHAFAGILDTGVTRLEASDVLIDPLLGNYMFVAATSVSGDWDFTVELWYSTADVS